MASINNTANENLPNYYSRHHVKRSSCKYHVFCYSN